MKRIATIILILLAVICMFAFVACGDKIENDNADNIQQEGSGNNGDKSDGPNNGNNNADNTQQGGSGNNGDKPDGPNNGNNGETAGGENNDNAGTGGNENNVPQVTYTVNEDEWKVTLLALFDGKHSVVCESDVNWYDDVWSGTYEFDCNNKVEYSDFIYEQGEIENYTWIEEDGKVYAAVKTADMVSKQLVDNEYYEIVISDDLWGSCGGFFLIDDKIYEKYGDALYNENSKEYKLTSKTENKNIDYTLKFEDGKIIEFYVEVNEINTNSYKYAYDKEVTVPQDILNMSVTEE